MFWADELAAIGAERIPGRSNDSKTPSGTVHVGSLRGVVLHDADRRALRDHGLESSSATASTISIPMDSQALLTPDAIDRYMGVPLAHVPAPEGSTATSLRPLLRGRALPGHVRGPRHPPAPLLDERAVRLRADGPVHPHGARQRAS